MRFKKSNCRKKTVFSQPDVPRLALSGVEPAPSQHKYTLIIKFYNDVFGLSLNRHLKQTAVVKSVFYKVELVHLFKCQVSLNYLL